MNHKQQINKTAIYCRLSVEDKNVGESGSIETQKSLLRQYCKEKQFNIVDCYVDDGVSGTSFERPGFERMLADIDAGNINAVVTKDLSRFGRDYIQAGYYIEKVFKQKDVRFIAVSDNIDTANGVDDILMPIKNVINDMYCREASRKTKAAHQARAKEGKYLGGHAPFGYVKNPDNKHQLIVDPPAATVVRNIFELASQGIGYGSIAKALRTENILNPQAYFNQNNPDFYKKSDYWRQAFDWHVSSIMSILKNPVYTGAVVFGRTKTKIISTNRRSKTPEDEWILVEGMHEPLVSKEAWDVVQKLLAGKRRECKNGEIQIFAGLVKCGGCGSALNLASKSTDNGGRVHKGFSCWVYKNYGKERCTSHAIGYKTLYTLVYDDIRRNAVFASLHEKRYLQKLLNASYEKQKKELEKSKREIRSIEKRLTELDKISSKIYEDICCKGRKSNPSNTDRAAGSSVAV